MRWRHGVGKSSASFKKWLLTALKSRRNTSPEHVACDRWRGSSPGLIPAQGKRLWRMASDEQSAAIFCMSMRLRASNCSQRTVMRTPLCVE